MGGVLLRMDEIRNEVRGTAEVEQDALKFEIKLEKPE